MTKELKIIDNLPVERWEEYKNLYLEMVKNEPMAFSETLDEILKTKDEEWQNELQEVLDKKSVLIFAEHDGILIGMGGASFHRLEKMKHNSFLSSLYVNQEFRGLGIGKQIIEKRVELILQHGGIKNIFCEIIETQTASIELHKKLGFEVVGEFKDIFKIEGKFYSEFYLQKQID